MNFFTKKSPPEIARPAISLTNRLGSFKYAGGLLQTQVRLTPARQDAFEKVHKALKAECEQKKNKATRERDSAIHMATDSCQATLTAADATFDRALHEAFLEHGKPPSVQEVAEAMTAVDRSIVLAKPSEVREPAVPAQSAAS